MRMKKNALDEKIFYFYYFANDCTIAEIFALLGIIVTEDISPSIIFLSVLVLNNIELV